VEAVEHLGREVAGEALADDGRADVGIVAGQADNAFYRRRWLTVERVVVPTGRFELPTYRLGGGCSIP
jgi:hypothetical protein